MPSNDTLTIPIVASLNLAFFQGFVKKTLMLKTSIAASSFIEIQSFFHEGVKQNTKIFLHCSNWPDLILIGPATVLTLGQILKETLTSIHSSRQNLLRFEGWGSL